jgi:protein-tyrosine phosphatase
MKRFNRLLRQIHHRARFAMGQFDNLKYIQAERIDRIVFVCRGNVCRSPYAEAAAKSLGLQATSCGVDVIRSAPAEPMAVRAALMRGKDLSMHMSRSIFDVSLGRADLLVAMDPSHLPVACEVAAGTGSQVTLIGLWRKPTVTEIADPYGKPLLDYCQCFDRIDEALSELLNSIKHPPRGPDSPLFYDA